MAHKTPSNSIENIIGVKEAAKEIFKKIDSRYNQAYGTKMKTLVFLQKVYFVQVLNYEITVECTSYLYQVRYSHT